MKAKHKYILIASLLGAGMALAQPNFAQAPVYMAGKPAPVFSLTVYGTGGKNLGKKSNSDFLGRWLILDFWTRSCIACITSMPKLSELQQTFQDKAKLVLIGKNDKKYNEGIQALYRRLEKSERLNLSTAFDTASFTTFKVRSTPHVVLIDPKGKVYAVTNSSELSTDKLSLLFAGKEASFETVSGFTGNPVLELQ